MASVASGIWEPFGRVRLDDDGDVWPVRKHVRVRIAGGGCNFRSRRTGGEQHSIQRGERCRLRALLGARAEWAVVAAVLARGGGARCRSGGGDDRRKRKRRAATPLAASNRTSTHARRALGHGADSAPTAAAVGNSPPAAHQ